MYEGKVGEGEGNRGEGRRDGEEKARLRSRKEGDGRGSMTAAGVTQPSAGGWVVIPVAMEMLVIIYLFTSFCFCFHPLWTRASPPGGAIGAGLARMARCWRRRAYALTSGGVVGVGE